MADGKMVLMNTVLASPPVCVQPQGRPRVIVLLAGPFTFAAFRGSMTEFPCTEFAVTILFRNTMPLEVRLSVLAAVMSPPE